MMSSQVILAIAATFLMIGAVFSVWSSLRLQRGIAEEPELRDFRRKLVRVAVPAFLIGFLLIPASAFVA